MADLLFEIGCEELPAGFIDPALIWLENAAQKELAALRLTHGSIQALGTPRRLTLMVRDVAEQQPDMTLEVLGPKVEIAYDATGALSKAGLGFLRSKNISEQQAYRKDTDKGAVIAAKLEEKGQLASKVLPDVLLRLMREIPFAKTMKWDESGATFARPVRWLVCLLGNDVLPIEFAGVKSSNQTCGHRFLSPSFVAVEGIDSYLIHLSKNFVMLDGEARKKAIEDGAAKLAKQAGGDLRADAALLQTVKNLVEYPWPIMGHFEPDYLDIPKEILISEMREHQKYFAVVDAQDNLLPAFIVAAGSKPKNDADVAAGNGRVLKARFEDGAFYYREDCKKPLGEFVPKLGTVMFQKELGSILDKAGRIGQLTSYLCDALDLSPEVKRQALRTAELCKADLVSGVVGQFPELQGVMGRIYAKLSSEVAEVATGIEEHYLPRFATDRLPSSDVGAVVGLADRIDTLVGVIGIGKAPKGNADPFALRRAAIALVKLLVARGYRVSLRHLVQHSLSLLTSRLNVKAHEIEEEVLGFIQTRARGILIEELQEKGVNNPTLLADAAMGASSNDMSDLWARVDALRHLQSQSSDVFAQLAATFKRAGNIVAKARTEGQYTDGGAWNKALLTEVSERELLAQIEAAQKGATTKHGNLSDQYIAQLGQIASLKPYVDRFFDGVMVMADDAELRRARLGLLAELEKMVRAVADFTRISIDG